MVKLTKEKREALWMKRVQNQIGKGKEGKLSETSKRVYAQRIRRLWKMMNGNETFIGHKFLRRNIFKNIKFINESKLPDSSKKGIYSAIVGTYHEDDKSKVGKKHYKAELNRLMKEEKNNEKEQKRNDKQLEKWQSQEQLKEGREKLLKIALKSRDINHWRDYILFFMLTVAPPRRAIDYGNMKITNNDKDLKKKDKNYIFYDKIGQKKRFKKFIFNDFKLADKKGSETFNREYMKNLPEGDEIVAALDDWLTRNPTNDFLVQERTPNAMSRMVLRVSKKVLNVPINLNLFRHMYISNFLKDSPFLLDKEAVALWMSHSVERQALYRKRVDQMEKQAEDVLAGFERGEPEIKREQK